MKDKEQNGNADETYLQIANDYTDRKIKEQESVFLELIMAGREARIYERKRSWTAIILSAINVLLWIFTLVTVFISLKLFI